MHNVSNSECVARVLKPVWYSGGIVSAEAFLLRPNINEGYISVLREMMPTFREDAITVARGKANIPYASIKVSELTNEQRDSFSCSVMEIDNNLLKSHAGIFISYHGKHIIAAEPLKLMTKELGIAEHAFLIHIGRRIARMVKDIKYLNK